MPGFKRASEAARRFGWSYSRYMNYENGERSVPPKQAILFASAYGVTVDYIYFGKRELLNQLEGTQTLISRMVRRIPLVALENMTELKRIASGLEPTAVTVPVGSFEIDPGEGNIHRDQGHINVQRPGAHLLRARR